MVSLGFRSHVRHLGNRTGRLSLVEPASFMLTCGSEPTSPPPTPPALPPPSTPAPATGPTPTPPHYVPSPTPPAHPAACPLPAAGSHSRPCSSPRPCACR